MEDQPTAGVELSDEDLDAAVQAALEDDEPATGAPEDTTAEPVSDDGNSDPVSTDNAPAGDAPPEPDVAAQPVPEAASAPAAPVQGKPFQFKASGRDHTLPWASELPDGSVVIPKEQRTEFQRELASARELQTNFRNLQRQSAEKIREAQSQRTQKDADADASIALMAELVQLTPEAQWQYLQELQGNLPRLQIDLERRKLQEQQKAFEQQQRGPQLSPEEQQERFTETVHGELAATLTQLEQHETFKALTAEDKQTLRARYEQRPDLLVRRATEDVPQAGIQKGDVLFDPTHLVEDAKFLLANRKPATPAVPSPTAKARNAALNADRQTPVNPIPPSVRSQTPTGQPRAKNGQYKAAANNRAFRDDFMKNDEDDE